MIIKSGGETFMTVRRWCPMELRGQMCKTPTIHRSVVDMDTLIEFTLESADWIASKAGVILVLLATLPWVPFLKGGRLPRYGAFAVFAGAATVILLGIESLAAAVTIVIANSLLLSIIVLSTSRRLARVEAHLKEVAAAVQSLETAEQRRQTFAVRNPLKVASRPHANGGGEHRGKV